MSEQLQSESVRANGAQFTTTHWSVVLEAGANHSPRRAGALEALCRLYWSPLYCFVRRRGHSPHDAQDLTQEFFASLLARQDLAQVHPGKGKFRTFLLACLDHFLSNDWRRRQTQKRGGGQILIPLNPDDIEERLAADSSEDPARVFDRHWAAAVLEQAIEQLRQEMAAEGKDQQFGELSVFLTEPSGANPYEGAAARLNMTPGAVATSVHRLRKRYRELVRGVLAQTVTTPLELEEEMRYLLEVCA